MGEVVMMGLRLRPDEIEQRLADAKAYKYNPEPLGELWGLQSKTAAGWMRENCRGEYFKAMYERQVHPVYNEKREKPEWEYEWVNDFQVLTREEYMAKYHLTYSSYATKLCNTQKKFGYLATPERRARWERDL